MKTVKQLFKDWENGKAPETKQEAKWRQQIEKTNQEMIWR